MCHIFYAPTLIYPVVLYSNIEGFILLLFQRKQPCVLFITSIDSQIFHAPTLPYSVVMSKAILCSSRDSLVYNNLGEPIPIHLIFWVYLFTYYYASPLEVKDPRNIFNSPYERK